MTEEMPLITIIKLTLMMTKEIIDKHSWIVK